jgi:hypothetical protein
MKTILRSFLLFGALASAIAAIPAYAAPPTIIASAPFTITVPGKYVLHNNLTIPPGAVSAITITCSDVIVDLNGYTIIGPGGGIKSNGITGYNTTGAIGALSNIIIRNGTITNCLLGITFFAGPPGYGATDSIIEYITLRAINATAISDDTGKGNHIKNCIIIPGPDIGAGIQLTNCTDDVVSGNRFYPLPVHLPAPYETILLEGTVEGNVVVNNEDANP